MRLEYLYRAWRYRLQHDKNEINYLIKMIKKNTTAFDIGAHKGAYTYWLRKCVDIKGKVIAFEPQIKLANYLKNIYTNEKNVTIESIGLSNIETEKKLYYAKEGSPGASFNQMHDDIQYTNTHDSFFTVNTTTLSSYVKKHKLENISFIKCDVEGHELAVFQGAKDVLSYFKPILLFECENRHQLNGQTMLDVFQYLENLNYQGYFFLNNKITPVNQFCYDQYQCNLKDKKNYINNFIFKIL